MIHFWCLRLIFAPEVQKVLVNVIELGVWVKHSNSFQFLIVDHYIYMIILSEDYIQCC